LKYTIYMNINIFLYKIINQQQNYQQLE